MTRGRKKDHTIPPSRALVVQRDYRARKAQYVSDLEKRCKAAEEENVRLRQELEAAKMGGPFVLSAETARASTELMQSLMAATASLAKFQNLASSSVPSWNPPPKPLELQPASFPSPVPSSQSPHTGPSSSAAPYNTIDIRGHPHSHDFYDKERSINSQRVSRHTPSPSPSSGSQCCGGYFDCRDLVEEEEDELENEDGDEENAPMSITRTSGIRFTADEGMHRHRLPRS